MRGITILVLAALLVGPVMAIEMNTMNVTIEEKTVLSLDGGNVTIETMNLTIHDYQWPAAWPECVAPRTPK
jgi:poly(A) polymerase Pap1